LLGREQQDQYSLPEVLRGQQSGKPLIGEVPFTPSAKKVLELAVEEARSLGHSYVGTEHLLIGLTSSFVNKKQSNGPRYQYGNAGHDQCC